MSTGDPFGFNISAAADKKRRTKGRRGMSGAFETSTRKCDHEGCNEPGQYRAPKSPKVLDDYYWFCKEHIREYNLNWNYFQGQSEEEFQRFLDNATVWERPTKPFGHKTKEEMGWARHGITDPHEMLGANATQNPGRTTVGRKLPPTERRALDILDARDTMSKTEIRAQYKALIKVLHPDMNGGDRSQEEMLQEVVWAWDQIKDSRNFR
ncbi:J domain-containing protein [Paenirhodobacter populi]|uniref:Molecular chaperone DnaJ n=1 Tax=Paenirhodobacter populi TaxID=2306993 RepID=A0A443JVN5_9RHOB|nr:J domain-containing protein [Sinirhodobacter populi]RWR07628.1 molecular chaperone DnaJ [Sinirhodobacter populi]RWR24577.1 molecular chaperone DnaJ [Sinirhodobacter populi]RWR29575.1 molecular chaperone DnaJ [Sinirhodobacter populi]